MGADDTDLYAWATEQAALLRVGRLEEIDVDNVAEAIEGLAQRGTGVARQGLPAGLPWISKQILVDQFRPE